MKQLIPVTTDIQRDREAAAEQGERTRRRSGRASGTRRRTITGIVQEVWWAGLQGGRRIGPDGVRWAKIVGVSVVLLAVSAVPIIDKYWPYRYRNVKPLLETVLASQVTIDHYHRTYFPEPGFVADGVTLRRKSALDLPPIGTIAHVRVQGSWLDLATLRDRIQRVDLEGMKVELPAPGSDALRKEFPAGSSADFGGPSTAILEMRVIDARLDVLHTDGSRISFPIEKLVLRDVEQGKAVHYVVDLENAKPAGHIHAKGSFGPIVASNLAATPLGDDFSFTQVKLGDLGAAHGTLTARGTFTGTLGAIAAQASSDTPDFAIGKGHPTHVRAKVQCVIDATRGDVRLNEIAMVIGKTSLSVNGRVAGSPKVTNLELVVQRGRVEDLLGIFLHDKSPVTGVVALRGHALLRPGEGDFFSRLHVDGSFDVPSQKLTDATEQKMLSDFSVRAQGGKTDDDSPGGEFDALSSVAGTVAIRDGIVSTQKLTVAVPGASAALHGTYSLRSSKVDLKGEARMEADISHATTGFKSLLLKPFIPLFKRKHAGAVVPIEVTGEPGNYRIGADLF